MMLSCSNCGFLKVESMRIKTIVTVPNENLVTPYLVGNGSDFSISCWNPPKV